MPNIINNVLDIRKPEEHRVELEPLWVRANSLIGGALKGLAPSINTAPSASQPPTACTTTEPAKS